MNTIFNGEFATGHKSIKVLILKTMNSFKHRICVSGTSGNRSPVSISRRVSRTVGGCCRESWININKCYPMHMGYRFEMPREIITKRAVINVRSIMHVSWSVITALYSAERNDRGSWIFLPTLYDGVKFPKYRISYNVKRRHEFEHLNDVYVH